jgi:hypothetical protein
MKKLSTHLHMDPVTRKKKLDEFMYKLDTDPLVQAELKAWNVQFNPKALSMEARVLPKQAIVVGPDPEQPIMPDDKGDWTRSMKGE